MDARTEPGLDPRLEALLEHAEWARGLAGRLVADAARADDVVQSALAAAAKSPPRDATNLRGWLGQVVRNAARTVGREEGRRDHRERAAARPEAIEGADELVARAEMSRDLAQHVLALDEIYRDVVLLRWYEGLAPREIAKRLGVPVATVNTRLARAHGELRTRLDRAYGDRASWCAAFAPMAVLPKGAVPVGALAIAASVLLVAGRMGYSVWRSAHDTDLARSADGAVADAPRISLPGRTLSDRASPGMGPVRTPDAADRAPVASTAASGVSVSALPSLHVEGRAIGFDGRGLSGLALRARDPKLPRIVDGWLHVGNVATTIDAREIWEWKNIPEALESTLAHHGNPVGLREVLLGADLSASTTTRTDGSFAFDVPGSHASLETPDERYVLVASGREAEGGGEIVLVAPAVRVAGTVVDEKGLAVAGARVHAIGRGAALKKLPYEFDSRFEPVGEILTNAEGRFSLGSVASHPGARIAVSLDTQYIADVEMPTADNENLVIRAKIRPRLAKPRVRGVVLDERGAGIAGASVRMGGNAVVSDEAGRFELEEENFGPESEIVAVKQGWAPGWIAGLGKELREKRLVENVEIRLNGPALSITGRAVDAEGRALEGWMVTLADTVKYPTMGIPLEFAAAGWYGDRQQPTTDGDGRFEVSGLAPQAYRVRVTDRETGLAFTSAPIRAGARDIEVRLIEDAWRDVVRGRTVSTRGAPIPDLKVTVVYTIRESRGFTTSGHAGTTNSDSDGEFELEHVPRRGLKLSVEGESIRFDTFAIPDDADPNDVVLTVTIEHSFRVEPAPSEGIDEFEVLDGAGKRLLIEAETTTSNTTDFRVRLDAGSFPVCKVSEEGATIVLYRKDQEVRRAPITWTGERIQVLRP